MKTILLLLSFLLISNTNSNACLNSYYSIDKEGHLHSADDLQRAFNTNFNLKLIERKLTKLKQQLDKKQDYKLLSDYAVLLLKAGKTTEALDILIELSKHYPNEYKIASNLGTAYELNGDVEKAIQFIKRGMELSPGAHEGSEWVHISVLETKLKMALDTAYLSKNSVLNLTEEKKNNPLIRDQILIQVRERFPFSPGPNPIMVSLLIDLADCYVNTASIEFSKALYTISENYYGAEKEVIDAKIKAMLVLRNKYSKVYPEKRQRGQNIKIHGIPYKSLLDDNNVSKHQIDWTKIPSDANLLLANLGLLKIETTKEKVAPEDSISEQRSVKSEPASQKSNWNIYLLIVVLFSAVVGFWIYKTRAQK
jgi:tetratricopeptide (TPR) repeat protein